MTKPEVLIACGNRLGEAPLYLKERNLLLWIDLPTAQLWQHNLKTGTTKTDVLKVEPLLGAIVPTTKKDTVLLAHRRAISQLNINTLKITPFADPEDGRDAVMYNDAKMDRRKRLWVGTSHVTEQEARGALWIVDGKRKSSLVDAGFMVSNGPAFSTDGKTVYFSDSAGYQIFTYDIDDKGKPVNRRLLCKFEQDEGMPDGMTVDQEGGLWVAHWAGSRVTRRDAQGKVTARIDVPSPHVTSLCFGGEDYRTLFITTAWEGVSETERAAYKGSGHLFALVPGPKGLAEPRFPI